MISDGGDVCCVLEGIFVFCVCFLICALEGMCWVLEGLCFRGDAVFKRLCVVLEWMCVCQSSCVLF